MTIQRYQSNKNINLQSPLHLDYNNNVIYYRIKKPRTEANAKRRKQQHWGHATLKKLLELHPIKQELKGRSPSCFNDFSIFTPTNKKSIAY